MPIIVLDSKNNERYVLVSVADERAAIADSEGKVRWLPLSRLTVIDVDGTPPIELLADRRKGGSTEIVEDLLDDTKG